MWLTVPEAAERLGCCPGTLRKWCRARKIEHKREECAGRGGFRRILLASETVDEYNRRHTVAAEQKRPVAPRQPAFVSKYH